MRLIRSLCLIPIINLAFANPVAVIPKDLQPAGDAPTYSIRASSTAVIRDSPLSSQSSTISNPSASTSSASDPSTPTQNQSSCEQTIKPDTNGYVPPGTCHSYYDYYPSLGAAALFSALFVVLLTLHIIQAVYYQKPFCWVIIMGAAWESAAFVTRTLSTQNQQNTWLVIISNTLILLAPLWISAFQYMVLARMIHFFLPSRALLRIRASTVAIALISMDIISFVVQLTGAAMAPPTALPDRQVMGMYIYMGGIGFQEVTIFLFLGLVLKFHLDWDRAENAKLPAMKAGRDAWRLLCVLYASLGLITIRIVYRMTEFAAGTNPDSPLRYHEVFVYVFEGVPILLAIAAATLIHPGKVLLGFESELPSSRLWKCGCCRGRWHRKEVDELQRRPTIIKLTGQRIGYDDLDSLDGSEFHLHLGDRELDLLERYKGSRFSPF